jgi:hypothetical protein
VASDLLLPAWSRLLLREPAVLAFPRRRPPPLRGEFSTSAAVELLAALSSEMEPREASLRLFVREPSLLPLLSPLLVSLGRRRSASLLSALKSLMPSSEEPADVTLFAAARRCRPRFRFSGKGNDVFLETVLLGTVKNTAGGGPSGPSKSKDVPS